jgi:uncharacterized protein YkwD
VLKKRRTTVPTVSQPQPSQTVQISISNFDQCKKDFQNACVNTHNKYRTLHKAPPLRTNTDLQQSALSFAKKMALKNVLQHSGKRDVGENVAYSWSSSVKSLRNCAGKSGYYGG